jgi:hypothetical protein
MAAASPAKVPARYIAYLSDGHLWAIRSDGTDQRLLAIAPPNEVIHDFLWSLDGQHIYFAVGARLFDAAITTGNLASAGELKLPATVSLNRLELGRDGNTIIAQTSDTEGFPHAFSIIIGTREAQELSVDEYTALAQQVSPTIRNMGEMSVAPDARFVLYKEALGATEELFVADLETGRRWQVSDLAAITDFEPSAEATGGRFIIEATWSPDGRYIIYNPAQACSDSGLCYGKLFLVEMWGGPQKQLSLDMMISLPAEWDMRQTMLVYDDEEEIVISDKHGQTHRLASGSRPKWQPEALTDTSLPALL